MLIRKEHAIILYELMEHRNSEGYTLPPEKINEEALTELILAGMVRKLTPSDWLLTYHGARLARAINELTSNNENSETPTLSRLKDNQSEEFSTSKVEEAKNIEEAKKDRRIILEYKPLPPKENWSKEFRLLGTEIINLLDAANKAGRVGPEGEVPLLERGLAARVRWEKRKFERVELTEAGKQILDIYRSLTPMLELDATLGETIRKLPEGPTESANFSLTPHEKHKLENMRLIAYSQPDSEFVALTALGQAVRKTLSKGGFASEGSVLNPSILNKLAKIADGEEVDEKNLDLVKSLGYVGGDENLLPAGELALEVLRLYRNGPEKITWSFSLEKEEGKILRTTQDLWKKSENDPQQTPTFDRLRREMIDRKVEEYKRLIEKYGRYLKERPKREQEIAESMETAANYSEWYDKNFDLRKILHSLESFNLIKTAVDQKGREIFHLTPYGQRVKEDQEENPRTIPSKAVKTITLTRKEFSVPNAQWCRESRDLGLLGNFGATNAGQMYANLAENIERTPYLTNYELRVFKAMPIRGLAEEELYDELEGTLTPSWIRWALDKLEARELIERLSDGNIIKTQAGTYMDKALAGVPEGWGMPVNPTIFQVIKGMAEVGTLYETENKIRVAPGKVKEAIEKSGLNKDTFQKASEAARAAGFIGKNSINEAGQHLLKAMEVINHNRPETRFVELLEK